MNREKQSAFELKAVNSDGIFEGYCSVFGNLDSDNEVIDKGAFKGIAGAANVPILFSHDRTRPVGWNIEAKEDDRGLRIKGRLMVDTEDGRTAQSFLKLGLEVGGQPGLSIGFTVPNGGEYRDSEGIRHFREVALKEYSIVVFPANAEARVTAAKSAANDVDPEKIGGMLDDVHQCFQAAKTAHEKALGSLNQLRDFVSNWYAARANDVNLPNPVGNRNRDAEAAQLIRETEDFLRRTKEL